MGQSEESSAIDAQIEVWLSGTSGTREAGEEAPLISSGDGGRWRVLMRKQPPFCPKSGTRAVGEKWSRGREAR